MVANFQPRRHERVRIGGSVRVLVDTAAGLVTASGQLIDLSEAGCCVILRCRIEPYSSARVEIEVARRTIWIPVETRWVEPDAHGRWRVGCVFDRPTAEKERAIRQLINERRRLVG